MNERTEKEAIAHALREYPRESCGLVVVVKGKERYFPCRNVASDPTEKFVIHSEDRTEAEDVGSVMAVVHSHPNCGPNPSEADRVQCELSGMPWYIIAVNTVRGDQACEVVRFEPTGYEPPLEGRVFDHGIIDCYSLCRDWYKKEMGIVLPNYHRDDKWWEKGQTLYEDKFREAGFEVVMAKDGGKMDLSKIEIGDGVLMQIRSPTPNHAAIYVGDGMILHHLENRLSGKDLFDGYFQECAVKIVRYSR